MPYELLICHFCAGAQRDLTGCSAIPTSALELNVSLKPQKHEKFLAFLLDSHRTNKELLRTKQQHYRKPLKVPSFQLKFWIWIWNVKEWAICKHICHVVNTSIIPLHFYYNMLWGWNSILLKITVPWNVRSCSLVDIYQRFRGTSYLQLQGRVADFPTMTMEAIGSSPKH
jgi:hypothetical protein